MFLKQASVPKRSKIIICITLFQVTSSVLKFLLTSKCLCLLGDFDDRLVSCRLLHVVTQFSHSHITRFMYRSFQFAIR